MITLENKTAAGYDRTSGIKWLSCTCEVAIGYDPYLRVRADLLQRRLHQLEVELAVGRRRRPALEALPRLCRVPAARRHHGGSPLALVTPHHYRQSGNIGPILTHLEYSSAVRSDVRLAVRRGSLRPSSATPFPFPFPFPPPPRPKPPVAGRGRVSRRTIFDAAHPLPQLRRGGGAPLPASSGM